MGPGWGLGLGWWKWNVEYSVQCMGMEDEVRSVRDRVLTMSYET